MRDELQAEQFRALAAKFEARVALERAREAEADARAAHREAKKAYEAACRAVEEIEEEILTGRTGRPLLDAIAAPAPGPEAKAKAAAVKVPGRPASPWAEADLKLREAIKPERKDRPDPWAGPKSRGSLGDLEALATLTDLWPVEGLLGNGWTAKGGHHPAFWDTDKDSKERKPPLWERAELAEAVRRVLHLAPPPEDRPAPARPAPAPTSAADAAPVRRRRKPEALATGANP